jgi:hypothetical protein
MKTRTINIFDFGVDQINDLLENNINAGWIFLGYGLAKIQLIEDNPEIDIPIMSFRHDDWTEDTEFFER